MAILDFDGNKSYIGLCLFESERNMYDDSDFYMTVWDKELKAPKKICFASTRGACGAAYGSFVDATPDVLEAYNNWLLEQQKQNELNARKSQAYKLLAFRKECQKAAQGNAYKFYTLKKTIGLQDTQKILNLLNGRIRNQFKLNLKSQVLAWLSNPAPQYKTPLSNKQMQYI